MNKLSRKHAFRVDLKEKILLQVWKMFCYGGYSRIDYPKLCRFLGITKGALYYFWGGRNWTCRGALDRCAEEAILFHLDSCFVGAEFRGPSSYLYDYLRRFPDSPVAEVLRQHWRSETMSAGLAGCASGSEMVTKMFSHELGQLVIVRSAGPEVPECLSSIER